MDIRLKEVSKSFGKVPVLKNVSMEIRQGDIICLLGPSGSGKSTLIRLMLGALAADSGEIRFGDTRVPNLPLLGNVGYMPQNDAVYTDLSGEANLTFFGRLHSIPRALLKERIEAVLEMTDLTCDRNKLVRDYSGGMKKRLSLAAALLHEPEVLLLDEPTVGIDPVLRKKIWEAFRELQARGKSIVVTTHVMDEVAWCDKAALLYGGEVIEYGAVDELLKKTEQGRIEELFFRASSGEREEVSS
ncbi:MAG: ABC transporter ATP-binding protein [Clostridiales Family XIII bacterium]|jgi:ABC-2 type transport system ATP-binding protein|nr:ABC transporter ATP-binding protein [Clostridiales Family XIII bacterium]